MAPGALREAAFEVALAPRPMLPTLWGALGWRVRGPRTSRRLFLPASLPAAGLLSLL